MLNMKFEIKQNEYSVATKWRLCAAEAEKTIYIMMIYIKIVNLRFISHVSRLVGKGPHVIWKAFG